MSGFVSGSRKSLAARVAALVMVGLAAPRFATPGYAQYFGHNKVQYQSFDFRILRTPHFDVYYYPEEQVAAGLAGRMAERWYTRLSTSPAPSVVRPAAADHVLHPGPVRADQRGPGPGRGNWRRHRGAAPPDRAADRRDAGRSEPRHRPRAHARLSVRHDRYGRPRRGKPRGGRDAVVVHRGHGRVPVARPGRAAHRDVDAGRRSRTPSATRSRRYRQLDDPRYFPYRYGQALLAYVGGTYGDDHIAELLRASGRVRSVDQAIRGVPEPVARPARGPVARRDAPAFDSLQARTELPDRYGPKLVGVRGEEWASTT